MPHLTARQPRVRPPPADREHKQADTRLAPEALSRLAWGCALLGSVHVSHRPGHVVRVPDPEGPAAGLPVLQRKDA